VATIKPMLNHSSVPEATLRILLSPKICCQPSVDFEQHWMSVPDCDVDVEWQMRNMCSRLFAQICNKYYRTKAVEFRSRVITQSTQCLVDCKKRDQFNVFYGAMVGLVTTSILPHLKNIHQRIEEQHIPLVGPWRNTAGYFKLTELNSKITSGLFLFVSCVLKITTCTLL